MSPRFKTQTYQLLAGEKGRRKEQQEGRERTVEGEEERRKERGWKEYQREDGRGSERGKCRSLTEERGPHGRRAPGKACVAPKIKCKPSLRGLGLSGSWCPNGFSMLTPEYRSPQASKGSPSGNYINVPSVSALHPLRMLLLRESPLTFQTVEDEKGRASCWVGLCWVSPFTTFSVSKKTQGCRLLGWVGIQSSSKYTSFLMKTVKHTEDREPRAQALVDSSAILQSQVD